MPRRRADQGNQAIGDPRDQASRCCRPDLQVGRRRNGPTPDLKPEARSQRSTPNDAPRAKATPEDRPPPLEAARLWRVRGRADHQEHAHHRLRRRVDSQPATARRARSATSSEGCIWVFRVNRAWSRDAAVGGNIARFINHSCTPELLVRGRRTRRSGSARRGASSRAKS